MPSRSHGRCKVCRAITHINSRFGLCAVHMRQRNKRIADERRETKARRARRLAASTVVLEEGPALTDIEQAAPGKKGRPHSGRQITDEQAIEILDAYTQTDESVGDICNRFGIKHTYIYNVLGRLGIDWRRGNPESYETWQARQAQPKQEETVPPEVEHALENMLRLPTVLPPRPEPVAPTPAVERRVVVSNVDALHWRIKVQGTLDAYYPTIEEALASVRRLQPGVRITGIELVED